MQFPKSDWSIRTSSKRLEPPSNQLEKGDLATRGPNWAPGHRIHRGPADALEVVRIVAAEDGDDVNGYLVVAAVAKI